MGQGDCFFDIFKISGVVQVAHAAAIGAAETGLWLQPLANDSCNFAFQVKFGLCDDRFNEIAFGQQIIYMPASCLSCSFAYLDMAIYTLESTGTPC